MNGSDLRGRALVVVLGCLVCQLGLGFAYLYSPLLKVMTDELGWSRALFASARAPYLFTLALMSPVVGVLVVRLGARRVLCAATLILGATFFVLSRTTSVWQLYLANVLWGLFMVGLGDIVVSAVVCRWVERSRGLALGVVLAGSNLGGMMLPPVFTLLLGSMDWRRALLVLAGIGVAVIGPAALFLVREPAAGEGVAPRERGATGPGQPALGLAEALRTRSFWLLTVALATFFFYFLGANDHLFAALEDAGMSRMEAARAYATAVGVGGLSKVFVGYALDRLPVRVGLFVNYALLAVSSLLLLGVPGAGFLQVFLVTYGLSVAARDVIYPLVVTHCFGLRSLSAIYGAMLVVLAPMGTLGSVVPGLVYDRTGSYDAAFSVFAALNVLVLVLVAFVRREIRPERHGPAPTSLG